MRARHYCPDCLTPREHGENETGTFACEKCGRAYEARWQAKGFLAPGGRGSTNKPQWAGAQSLQGRSIFLYPEQGLGDTIQFLRYVPLVAQRAREVLLTVQPAILPVLGELPSNVRVLRAGAPRKGAQVRF